jgi:O-antigen ligase
MIWRTAVDMVRDHPFSGIGVARFQSVYLEYQDRYTPYLEWAVPTPHNLTLHFFLEGGLLAFLGWLGVIGGLLFRFWNQWQVSHLSGLSGPITLLGAALLAFYLLYGLVDTPYMKNDLVLAVWGSIGLFLAALRAKE